MALCNLLHWIRKMSNSLSAIVVLKWLAPHSFVQMWRLTVPLHGHSPVASKRPSDFPVYSDPKCPPFPRAKSDRTLMVFSFSVTTVLTKSLMEMTPVTFSLSSTMGR